MTGPKPKPVKPTGPKPIIIVVRGHMNLTSRTPGVRIIKR